MHGNSTRENRETPSTPVVEVTAGRLEKAMSRESNMHADGFGIEGRAIPPQGRRPVARQYSVSPEYFRLLRIPLLQGRGIAGSDNADSLPVALISQTFARINFAGENPIGRRIRSERNDAWRAIVGSLVRYGRGVFSYQPSELLGNYALYFDHAPGKGHDDKFEFASSAYQLFKSACYRASRDSLTCTTCHNPHQAPMGKDTSARYARICQNCHAARISELAAQRRHPASEDCVSCHMLKRRPSDAIHVTITDHYIQRAPKRDPGGLPVEQNSSNTPLYRGEVKLYYPRQANGDAELYRFHHRA